MNETAGMIFCCLTSAGIGYICGLIVGRDTRTIITPIHAAHLIIGEGRSMVRQTVEEFALTETVEVQEYSEPQVLRPAARRGSVWGFRPDSARGFNPRWVSLSQDRPPRNAPLYATTIVGLQGWYFCTEAEELPDGRLRQTRTYFHRTEVMSWICEPGEWRKCYG